MLGNFLNIFKRQMWLDNIHCLDKELLSAEKLGALEIDAVEIDEKVNANAFKNSKAFFTPKALTVNGYGVREWFDLYDFIEIVRLPEMLDYYRSRGLGFFRYVRN